MSRDERALEAGLSDPAVPRVLATGELEVLGLLPNASNHTFLARATSADEELLAVYKPRRGEAPLWDFPEGTLCAREVAAYVVSRALGWPNVPATVLRDGPYGVGSVQRFVPHDPEEHYFTLAERFPEEFRRVAAFDMVVNNADRKSGHCLLGGGRTDRPGGSRGVLQRRAETPDGDLGLRRRPARGGDPGRRAQSRR